MRPDDFTDLLTSREHERCAEFALVLASQGIEAQQYWNGSHWVLAVRERDAGRARRELADYATESWAVQQGLRRNEGPAAIGRPWPGIVIYVVCIVAMALIAPQMLFGVDWLAVGRVDGAALAAGEWWRALTALTLHADAPHLLGNTLFGAFFGYSVARYLGGGFGWLLIVGCGALGNVANGLLSGVDHRSIGASTAVFAALGIVSSYCWRRGFPSGASRRERMAPVVAGIGLLAFTGTGGVNTDIGAHLLGFVAGFGGGLAAARFGTPQGSGSQLASGLAAFGLIVVAWLAALG